jgi:nucleoside-diphosphate-sugar epimerase
MILVTGASGFLGSHLVKTLSEKGFIVRALYHHTPPSPALIALPNVTWMCADLLDIYDVTAAMDGITHVYHAAAIVSYDARRKEDILHFNIQSTAHVVDEAVRQQVKKLVFVSSIAALRGSAIAGKAIDETEAWEESTFSSTYGKSKYYAEMEVWRGSAEGLPIVVVNPGVILGAGNFDKGSSKLMHHVASEFPFYTQGATLWVDVQDVVDIMLLLMESTIEQERFIIGSMNSSFLEVFTKMAKALGKKPPYIKASSFVSAIAARLFTWQSRLSGKEPMITKETAKSAQTVSVYATDKLLKALPGFQYRSLDSTIKNMATAYLALKKV